MKKFLAGLLIAGSFAATAQAGLFTVPADVGSQFLTIPISARSVALGSGLSGLTGDIHAFEYNPASLSSLEEYQFTFTRSLLYQGTNITSFGFGLQSFKNFGFGLQYRRFGTSDVTRDDNGFETGRDISVSDNGLNFGLSYRFWNFVSLGYSAEYIRRNLYTRSANGVAHSLGLQFSFLEDSHIFGFSVQNLGKPVTFETVEEKMPIVVRLGGSHQIGVRLTDVDKGFKVSQMPRLRAVWELAQFRDRNNLSWSGGMEWRAFSRMALRAGGQYRDSFQPCWGLGFRWKNYDIDYALQNRSEIGLAHSFSFMIRWGKEDSYFEDEDIF